MLFYPLFLKSHAKFFPRNVSRTFEIFLSIFCIIEIYKLFLDRKIKLDHINDIYIFNNFDQFGWSSYMPYESLYTRKNIAIDQELTRIILRMSFPWPEHSIWRSLYGWKKRDLGKIFHLRGEVTRLRRQRQGPVWTSRDFRVHKVEQRRVDNFSVALVTSYIHIQTPFTSWPHRVTAPHYRYFSRYSWINAKFVFTYFQNPLFQKSWRDRVKSIKNVGDTRCDIRSNDFQIIL